MEDPKESITFYRKGRVLTGKPPSEHIDKEYEVVRDEQEGDMRTIVLREKDMSVFFEKARILAALIADKVGEGESTLVKQLLLDVLKDYEEKTLDQLHKQIVEDGEPVKATEGCFKIIVGDGRTRKSQHIMLRE